MDLIPITYYANNDSLFHLHWHLAANWLAAWK